MGKANLISYARKHSAPNDLSIGRGMKVSTEEYLGMLVALETGLTISEHEDNAYKRIRFQNIINQISDINGVKTNIPPAGEGTPSKKLIFHDSFSSIVVKLNLASRSAQHTV